MIDYKFELNTSGWVEFFPIHEGCSIEKKLVENQIFSRVEFSGSLKFLGDEYDTLVIFSLTVPKVELKISYDGTVQFLGYILLSNSEYDIDKKILTCEVKNNDEYTKIIDGMDVDVELLLTEPDINTYLMYGYNNNASFKNRRVDAIIKLMVGRADSSILFDANSFVFLDDNYEHLMLSTTHDVQEFLKTSTLYSISSKLSFQSLMNMFREIFHVYWRLELVGSDYYFRMFHFSENSFGATDIDFSSYLANNWETNNQKYKNDSRYNFNLISRDVTAYYGDFIGTDIKIHYFDSINTQKKISSFKSFITDFDGFYLYPNKFPSDDSIFFLSTNDKTEGGEISLTTMTATGGANIFLYNNITKVLNANAGSPGTIYSNNFTVNRGQSFRVKFSTGYSPPTPSDPFPSMSITNCYPSSIELKSGPNEYLFVCYNNSAVATITFAVDDPMAFIISQFNESEPIPDAWLDGPDYYTMRISNGAMSGSPYANAELSIANIDRDFGKWELPHTQAEINGVLVTVNKKKNKKIQREIPVIDITTFDFTKYKTTAMGDTEPLSIVINLDFNPSKYEGVF